MSSDITWVLLGVVLVVGVFVLIKRFVQKKKQKDNFNDFIKPTIKETLKKEGYANHSYEIIHRYHHSLTNQNRTGKVDVILRVYNPKIGDSSSTNVGYTLMMKEVPVSKKEFLWDVESIERTEVESIQRLLVEKEERKKHKIKYFKKDLSASRTKTVDKIKSIKSGIFKKTNKEDKKVEKIEETKVSDPFEVL